MTNIRNGIPATQYSPKRNGRRALDLNCIATGRYATVATTVEVFPSTSVFASTALKKLSQAIADLQRSAPTNSAAVVIVDLPETVRLKLVVAAINQASLDIDSQSHLTQSSEHNVSTSQSNSYSIDESSMAEASRIAEASATIAVEAIGVGNRLVKQAETTTVSLEDALGTLAHSPNEKISRNTYGRAGGPERAVRFATTGEITIGGGHAVPSNLLSGETFSLSGCRLLHGERSGGFAFEGHSEDPEWVRLCAHYSGTLEIKGADGSAEMELLGHALASNQTVDIDVCIGERMTTKRRRLVPMKLRNRSEIIARIRDRLVVLDEAP